jgi:hypothetical protein
MANKSTKTLNVLPNPPKENLNSHFTLGEIIDHIHILQDEFPHVKIDLLKSHLWEIRNKNVEPEAHLRGFLSVFEETDVFKEAFEQLDDGMKIQLKTFIAGGSEDVVLAAGGKGNAFHLPPSPPVKHHFKLVTKKFKAKFEGLFHHGKHANGVNGVSNGKIEKPLAAIGEFPRIFEDEAGTKTMEVSHCSYIRSHVDL